MLKPKIKEMLLNALVDGVILAIVLSAFVSMGLIVFPKGSLSVRYSSHFKTLEDAKGESTK